MKRRLLIMLLGTIFFTQGCLVFLSNELGYIEATDKYSRRYKDYKQEIEQRNAQNTANGLPQEPVKEFPDWLKEQPLTYNEKKLFRERGIISDKDTKEDKEEETLKDNS